MEALFFLFFIINILLTQAKVTFKVIAVTGTPKVVVNNKKYDMTVDQYPIYKATVDVNAPVNYHYILNGSEESFTRVANGDTLNDFFNRKITVKKHPLLPFTYEDTPLSKKSKLYDDTSIATFLIEAPQSQIDNLHTYPNDSKLKYEGIKVTYVSPYNIKVFKNAKINISGQSTIKYKKLSYKLGGLKDDNDKELFGRTSIKLKAEALDPSMMREKIYLDMLNALGVPSPQSRYARVFINKKEVGLFLITDDLNNGHFLKNTFNSGEKYTVDNHIFKSGSEPSENIYADLVYYGQSSNKYDAYDYKGELKNVSSMKMAEKYVVPFLKAIDQYPSTKKIEF